MRYLFERLTECPEPPRACLERSLDQLAAVQYLSDAAAPPGVLNFGLPSPADVANNDAGLTDYALLVELRIRQFEPRLQDVRVNYTNGRISVTGTFGDRDEPTITWSRG